jgi:hypothetical protein
VTRMAPAIALALATAAPAAAQTSYLVVIAGLGGDPAASEAFHRWATTLVDAARTRYGLGADQIVYLAEDPARDPSRITGRSTRDAVEAAIAGVADRARPGDRVFIVLIGHGSADRGESRFNLPGPDMGARDFARLLERLAAQTVVFVNTASASGGFVPALAGRDRIVVAATKTEGERNQTRFAAFFAEAFATGAADLDKDGRVSLLEAFAYARRRVEDAYKQEGQILTEHAVLDDDGDGKGSEAPGGPGGDGRLARTVFLDAGVPGRPADLAAVSDPALRTLYQEQQALEARIAALRAARDRMPASEYEAELERLLVELARKTREIREREKKK